MKEVPLDVIELPKGRLLCVGTTRMVPGQDGGDHVRQAEIRLPPMQLDPIATVTVVPQQGVGTVFGVYSLKFGHVNGKTETQVVVHAANVQSREPSDFDFFCSYVIVGKRLANK